MWLTSLALYGLQRRNHSAEINRLMGWGIVALAVVMIYFAIGFLQNGLAASIYLRNIVLPLFLFQLALLTAATYEIRVTPFLVTIAIILIVCGYTELMFRDFWLAVTNGYTFWHFDELKATHSGVWEAEMRATGNVPVDLKDRFSFSFLNTPLLEDLGLSNILRILGPEHESDQLRLWHRFLHPVPVFRRTAMAGAVGVPAACLLQREGGAHSDHLRLPGLGFDPVARRGVDPGAFPAGAGRLRHHSDLYRPADRRLSCHRLHGRLERIPRAALRPRPRRWWKPFGRLFRDRLECGPTGRVDRRSRRKRGRGASRTRWASRPSYRWPSTLRWR